ncbi:MAG: LamG-like jellyroll fold domain-containing protein, partial [bacterium]
MARSCFHRVAFLVAAVTCLLPFSNMLVAQQNLTTVDVKTASSIFGTVDNLNWTTVDIETATSFFRSVDYLPDGTVWLVGCPSPYAPTHYGFRSTDHGVTWTKFSLMDLYGRTSCGITNIAARDANIALVGTAFGDIYRTTDGGAHWTLVCTYPTPGTGFIDGIKFMGNDTVLALGDSDGSGLFVARSTDAGLTWQRLTNLPNEAKTPNYWVSFLSYGQPLDVYGNHAWLTLYQGPGVNPAILRTSDKGETWQFTSVTLPTGSAFNYRFHAISFRDSLFGYGICVRAGSAPNTDNYLIKTTDGGQTWSDTISVQPGINHAEARTFAVKPIRGTNIVYAAGRGSTDAKIWKSTDNGVTWAYVFSTYSNGDFRYLSFLSETQGFAVGDRNAAFLTNKPGAPRNPIAFAGNNQVTITWRKSDDPNFQSYKIYGGTSPHPTTLIETVSGGITDTTKIISSLLNATRYYLRVTAVTALGESQYSYEVSATPYSTPLLGEYVPDGNTVLLLHMNETSGSNVADVSGFGNNGVTGSTIEDGRWGKGRRFSVSGEGFSIPHSPSLNVGTGAYTLETWFNTLGLPNVGGSIIHKRGSNGRGWFMTAQADGRVCVSVYNNGTLLGDQGNTGLFSSRLINDGRWHHLAAVLTQTSMLLYIDGALDTIVPILTQGSPDNDGSLVLGTAAGILDEVRISKVARSPQEFNLQLPPKNLSGTFTGTTSNLSWENGGGSVGLLRYKIYRGADSLSMTLIDSTTQLTYTNTGLTLHATYYYRVSSVDVTAFEGALSYATKVTISDSVLVTFTANTSTVPDTIKLNSFVQIRGTAPFLGPWDVTSQGIMTNIGGDYWRATIKLKPGDSLQYKYFTNVKSSLSVGEENKGWENSILQTPPLWGPNRFLVVGNSDTTLPLEYVNGRTPQPQYWKPYIDQPDSIDVLFRVNMQAQGFTQSNQLVGIRGSTLPLDWGKTIILTKESPHGNGATPYDGTNFWSGSVRFPVTAFASNIEYKFVIIDSNDPLANVSATESITNRILPASASPKDTTLYWKWWNDQPCTPPPTLLGEYSTDANTVLLLHLNESTGTTAVDASGLSNNGTATGTYIGTGAFGKARIFTSGNMINVPASTSLNIGNTNFTIEMRIKSSTVTNQPFLFYKWENESPAIPGFKLFQNMLQPDGRLVFTFSDGSTGVKNISSNSRIDETRWHHVAVVKNGYTYAFYIDGIKEGEQTFNGVGSCANSSPLRIGQGFSGTVIDEVRISNIARTPAEFNLQYTPLNLLAVAGDGNVRLSWDRAKISNFLRYRIYKGILPNLMGQDDYTSAIDDTTKLITGLENGTLKFFRVTADNAALEEFDYLAMASATPMVIPPAPTLVAPENGTGGFLLPGKIAWNPSSGASFYRFQVSAAADFSSLIFDQSGYTGTQFEVYDLAGNTTYYWRVNASSAGGTSAWSTVSSFVTQQILSPPISSQWTFARQFFSGMGGMGVHGVAVDPDGKVWIIPYNPSDSVFTGTMYRKTRAIYVLYPNSTPATFSPIKMITVNSVTDTLYNSSRGLSTDHQGNILFSSFDAVYKIDYKTGQGMNKVIPQPNVTITSSASDAAGNLFVGKVLPGYPIQIFNSAFNSLGNVTSTTTGYSRAIEVSMDGRDVYWPEYSNKKLYKYHSDNSIGGPYSLADSMLTGLAIESITWQNTTGLLWVSSGSATNPPVPPWTKQTWYGFNPSTKQIVDTIGWNPVFGTEQSRPRGIAFSPTGDTAYVACFYSDNASVQMFVRSSILPPPPPLLAGEYRSDANTTLLFHMNETSGSSVGDASGNGNNGTATGTIIVDGRFGKARSFNGTSDGIDLGKSLLSASAPTFTFESWIKMDYYPTPAGDILFNGTSMQTFVSISQRGKLQMGVRMSDGTNRYDSSQVVVPLNTWVHCAGIYDYANGRIIGYLNGLQVFNKNVSGLTPASISSENTKVGQGMNTYFHNGLIDEVRLSNRVRSPQEFSLHLPPKNLLASASGTKIYLSWQDDGGGIGLLRYKIYRGTDSTTLQLIDSTNTTSYLNSTGLTLGTKYFYRISSVDTLGFEGAMSYAVAATAQSGLVISSGLKGLWSQPTTWIGGTVPVSTDCVLIMDNDTVTIDQNFTIGKLTVGGGNSGSLFFNAATLVNCIVNGDITINNGASFRTIGSVGAPGGNLVHTLMLMGNLQSSGFIDFRSGSSNSTLSVCNITFAGNTTTTAYVAGSGWTSTNEFSGIIINKSGTARLKLLSTIYMGTGNSASPLNATSFLELTHGIVETGGNAIVLLFTGGSILGGSDSSYVLGTMGRGMTNGGSYITRLFPVGDEYGYRPVQVRSTTPGTATGHHVLVTALFGNANTGSSTFSNGIDKVSAVRFYKVQYMQGGVGAAQMSFDQFSPSYGLNDGVAANNQNLRVALSENSRSTWIGIGPSIVPYTTALDSLPRLISSDTVRVTTIPNGGTVYVALARALGTTENSLAAGEIPTLLGEYKTDANTMLLMHMNETGGSTVTDASGNSNHGVATGTTIVNGRFGAARWYNGTGDLVEVPNSPTLDIRNAITIEAWVYDEGAGGWAARYDGPIAWDMHRNAFFISRDGSENNALSFSMPVNRWVHVAAVYDGVDQKVYINGLLVAMRSWPGTIASTNSRITIGTHGDQWFKGIIDEMRLSNIARTPQEFNLHLPPQNLTASTNGTTVNLTWQDAGGRTGLLRYRIYRGIDSINVTLIDSTTQTSYANTGVIAGTIYVYRVGAVDSTGFETMSYAKASGIPAPPTLSLPSNGASGVLIPISIIWNASTGAQSYRIQVSTIQDFSSTVYDQSNLIGTGITVTFGGGTTYYWRVNATNSAGTSAWSPVNSFTTQAILPPPVVLGWQFVKTFFNSTIGSGGIHGLAVDPEGKVWITPFNASDSLLTGTGYRKTRVLYVFYPNGTQASFSPIKMITVGGITDTLYNTSRGLTTDHQGNILYSANHILYRIDYKTGQGLNKVIPQPNQVLTAAATDTFGNIFVGKVNPNNPIQVFDAGFNTLGNVAGFSTGYSRSIGVTRDGKDVFWPEYQNTKALIRYHSDNGAAGPYSNMENLFSGLAIESMTRHPVTGYIWVSSGSEFNPPVPPYTKQTWYAFNPVTKQIVDTIGWNMIPGTEQQRPRGIAFSPTGDTCYVGCFNFDGPVVQMFVRSERLPAVVRQVQAHPGDGRIYLLWNSSSQPERFLRFRIYGGTSPNPTTLIDSISTPNETSRYFTGLTNGVQYYYRITIVETDLRESISWNEVSAKPVSRTGSRSVQLWPNSNVRSTDVFATPGNRRTMEAWICPVLMGADEAIIYRRFTSAGTDPYLAMSLQLHRYAAGELPKLEFLVSSGTPGSVVGVNSGATTIPLRGWTHVAGVFSGDTLKVYVNGVEANKVAATASLPALGESRIGINILPAVDKPFYGFIDEVRQWSRARTQTEIQNAINGIEFPSLEQGLISYWKFEENNPPNLSYTPNYGGVLADSAQYRSNAKTELFSPFDPGGPPTLSIAPTSVDFGIYEMGEQRSHGVTLTNSGTGTLVGHSPTGMFLVPAGQNRQHIVYALLTPEGALVSPIEFHSNAPSSPNTIPCTGTVLARKYFDGNNIRTPLKRAGFVTEAFTNGPLLEWPKGSGKRAVYQAGLWLAGQVGGTTASGVAYYRSDFQAGTATGSTPVDPNNAKYRMYKISKGDNASNPDYAQWPADLGAPVNTDGSPKIIGDQTLYTVYNDLNVGNHSYGSMPIGAEVRQTSYGFNSTDALKNTLFIKYRIYNKGAQAWTNAYAGFWNDPDLGNPYDDFVACDINRNLAYVYNGAPTDTSYGSAPPAVGFVYLKGPVTGNPMKAVGYNAAGVAPLVDPNNAQQFYNELQGKRIDGSSHVDPTTSQVTTYPVNGDPVTNTGWIDAGPNDRRLLISCGPFNLTAGDSAEVVIAIVIAQGTSNINSITALRSAVDEVTTFFNGGSIVPPPASWNFALSTGKNATIAIPFAINPKIAATPLKTGDAIGVFFQRDNTLVCGGYSIWQEGQNAAVAVWGDNDQTPLKDGFDDGELIQFKIWDGQAGKEYPATVTYQSGPGVNYQTNGIYALSSLVGITS